MFIFDRKFCKNSRKNMETESNTNLSIFRYPNSAYVVIDWYPFVFLCEKAICNKALILINIHGATSGTLKIEKYVLKKYIVDFKHRKTCIHRFQRTRILPIYQSYYISIWVHCLIENEMFNKCHRWYWSVVLVGTNKVKPI